MEKGPPPWSSPEKSPPPGKGPQKSPSPLEKVPLPPGRAPLPPEKPLPGEPPPHNQDGPHLEQGVCTCDTTAAAAATRGWPGCWPHLLHQAPMKLSCCSSGWQMARYPLYMLTFQAISSDSLTTWVGKSITRRQWVRLPLSAESKSKLGSQLCKAVKSN